MAVFSKEFSEEVLKRLKNKNALGACPRCSHQEFTLVDGIAVTPIVEDTKVGVIGKKNVPSVMVVCKNCGYISHHAIGILNMMRWGDVIEQEK